MGFQWSIFVECGSDWIISLSVNPVWSWWSVVSLSINRTWNSKSVVFWSADHSQWVSVKLLLFTICLFNTWVILTEKFSVFHIKIQTTTVSIQQLCNNTHTQHLITDQFGSEVSVFLRSVNSLSSCWNKWNGRERTQRLWWLEATACANTDRLQYSTTLFKEAAVQTRNLTEAVGLICVISQSAAFQLLVPFLLLPLKFLPHAELSLSIISSFTAFNWAALHKGNQIWKTLCSCFMCVRVCSCVCILPLQVFACRNVATVTVNKPEPTSSSQFRRPIERSDTQTQFLETQRVSLLRVCDGFLARTRSHLTSVRPDPPSGLKQQFDRIRHWSNTEPDWSLTGLQSCSRCFTGANVQKHTRTWIYRTKSLDYLSQYHKSFQHYSRQTLNLWLRNNSEPFNGRNLRRSSRGGTLLQDGQTGNDVTCTEKTIHDITIQTTRVKTWQTEHTRGKQIQQDVERHRDEELIPKILSDAQSITSNVCVSPVCADIHI